MLESQRIELRLVELRSAIAAHPADGEVAALEALTTEYRAADVRRAACIITESADLDAARVAGDLDAAGQRELDAIGSNLQFGNYVSAAVEMRAADGAEAEYNFWRWNVCPAIPAGYAGSGPCPDAPDYQHRRAGYANMVGLIASLPIARRLRLGISMESVPAGQAVYMTTTAGATGSQRGAVRRPTAAAWTVGVKTMEPKRNAVHAIYNIEDAARLPGLSDALRRDMGMALTDAIDKAVFHWRCRTPTTTSYDITGLQSYAGLTEVTLTQAKKVNGR